ncbi:cytochrome P450 [Streptomyces sp. NPDC018352]|uniref:cytochrome P450 n=1 Tax=Streptomyces sp. NPDC018352 TaxID=3157194 RepID=UPI0033F8E054
MASTSLNLFDSAHLRDPYPAYAALREMGPAVRLITQGVWAIPRFEDVRAVFHDRQHFVSDGIALTDLANREILAGSVFSSDGDQHVRLRRVLSQPLTARSVKRLDEELRMRAGRLVEEHVECGSGVFDAAALSRQMAGDTVMRLMGLPEEVWPQLGRRTAAVYDVCGPDGPRYQQALPLATAIVPFLRDAVTRDAVAEDSWLEAIFRAVDGGELDASEAIPLASAYAVAAMDTTVLGLTEAIRQLAHHPKQWAALRQDTSLAENAIHEALRREAPVQGFGRLVAEKVRLGDTWIEAGEQVWLLYGSTGRDTDKWGIAADTYNIRRPNARDHLAFGAGRHMCAGIPLALMQARALLGALASRCARLAPAGEPNRVLNNLLRGWSRVPIAAQLAVPSSHPGRPTMSIAEGFDVAPESEDFPAVRSSAAARERG